MARFIVANRLAGMAERQARRAALDRLEASLGAHFDVRADNKPSEPGGRRRIYLETDPAELESVLKEFPDDVIVEPQVLRYPAFSYPGFVQLELAAQGLEPESAGVGR